MASAIAVSLLSFSRPHLRDLECNHVLRERAKSALKLGVVFAMLYLCLKRSFAWTGVPKREEAADAGGARSGRSSASAVRRARAASPGRALRQRRQGGERRRRPGFPGNEATGTKAGDNASARGAASSGTALGETGSAAAQAAKDAVETGIDVNIDPLKTKIGDINPLNSTLNPAASDAN